MDSATVLVIFLLAVLSGATTFIGAAFAYGLATGPIVYAGIGALANVI